MVASVKDVSVIMDVLGLAAVCAFSVKKRRRKHPMVNRLLRGAFHPLLTELKENPVNILATSGCHCIPSDLNHTALVSLPLRSMFYKHTI